MKKTLIILGFIGAILGLILSVTPFFKLSIFPIVIAVLCGIGLIVLKNKKQFKTKAIQYVFLVSIIALGFTVYKSIFQNIEIDKDDEKEIEQRDDESKEDAIKELEDLDLEI